jgi:hypothetical protein
MRCRHRFSHALLILNLIYISVRCRRRFNIGLLIFNLKYIYIDEGRLWLTLLDPTTVCVGPQGPLPFPPRGFPLGPLPDIESSIQSWRENFLTKYHEQNRDVSTLSTDVIPSQKFICQEMSV